MVMPAGSPAVIAVTISRSYWPSSRGGSDLRLVDERLVKVTGERVTLLGSGSLAEAAGGRRKPAGCNCPTAPLGGWLFRATRVLSGGGIASATRSAARLASAR